MRTATTADLALLHTGHYDVHARLSVGGVELSTLLGYQPLVSATWTASSDAPTVQGRITVHRGEAAGQSLSPLMLNSPFNTGGPRLYPGEPFFLETATVAKGGAIVDGGIGNNLYHVLDGWIDRVELTGEGIVLDVRDTTAPLNDTWIEYGTSGGFATGAQGGTAELRDMMNIVVTKVFGPGVHNILGTISTFQVNHYIQTPMPVMEALRRLALLIGWDFRTYYTLTQQPVLTLRDPARESSVVVYTMGPTEYLDVRALTIDRNDVRNVIEVFYPPNRGRVNVPDTVSIANYGRRYMLISEDQSSGIKTELEALFMAQAALSDLKDPIAEQEIERHYFWPVELMDRYLFLANGVHYDQNHAWAVTGYTHTLNPDGTARTTIRTRGKPIAAASEWRRGKQRMVHVSIGDPVGVPFQGATWFKVADRTWAYP